MSTLREIRRRITSIKSTLKITKAMKMVAAAKLRRAQDSIIAARPYARKMNDLLRHLVTKIDPSLHSLLKQRKHEHVLMVVVTGDRGLCGAFNSNIIRKTSELIHTKYLSHFQNDRLKLICIGKKGLSFFSKREYPVLSEWTGIFGNLKYGIIQDIVHTVTESYVEEKFDVVLVIYNEFKSIIQQRVIVEQFLPIPAEDYSDNIRSKSNIDYVYEPNAADIINDLIPKHLNIQMWRILLESNAAEQGARMSAMDNANENAKELIDTLNLQYNKARQSSITKEILEITSGANALKDG